VEDDGSFSVNSCYRILEMWSLIDDNIPESEERVLALIWKGQSPLKVLAFVWTLLLDRIPTRMDLAFRGVLNEEASKSCVVCGREEETASHLFLHCDVVMRIWQRMMCWLEFHFLNNLFVHFECWLNEATSKKLRRGFCLIRLASIWVIWKQRNEIIFNNGMVDIDIFIEKIKILAWYWSMSELKIASCLYYEWYWNPRECLLR